MSEDRPPLRLGLEMEFRKEQDMETIETLDWLSERLAQAPEAAFARLQELVRLDTEQFNAARARRVTAVCQPGESPGYFSVVLKGSEFMHGAVTFRLNGRMIEVARPTGNRFPETEFAGELLLAPSGHRRIKVGEELLTDWQFRRRALEPLFFPEPE